MLSPFALYRLPHADQYVRVEGQTQELHAWTQLNGVAGFVVAPFQLKQSQPIVVIRPDSVETMDLPVDSDGCAVAGSSCYSEDVAPSVSYTIDFANFHSQLQCGTFQKIVLARCADETLAASIDPMALFFRACSLYPRLFIALVYTPQSGMWLTATPEILLEEQDGRWRTIALAGTMRLTDDQLDGEGETLTWSIKNIEEQRIVATYIAECLEQFTNDFHEEGPRTARAANLVHLRSDFTFTLPDSQHIGDLIGRLHPTPAVCGLPKREAFEFIIHNEHTSRRYYSGFMGPLLLSSTHLYVSLRCMNIQEGCCHLYAGGGLLRDSVMEQEWQETEAKLETMRRCIATRRM
ncbi:MAG: isochorismate synthase [Prevotella sp.]|nr:isochorismate synthase [Prevotella sp.]